MIEIETRGGRIRGFTRAGLRFWRGIPYAAPPVGPRRFLAPQPVARRGGIRTTNRFGPAAPQPNTRRTNEDCLHLNVVAPIDCANAPVLVFIHGGAYIAGRASDEIYHGEQLAKAGVVYVSITYRLGPLGYLDFSSFSSDDRRFDSNLGLRDQVAALEWVRDNIAAFGGNPDNVTIFGESSGANAVTTLMCTPAAAGLFHRAIAESPPAASAYSAERAKGWANEFLEELGTDVTGLLSATPDALVEAATRLTERNADEQPGTRALAPVVDGEFLPLHPLDVFADGLAHRVPLIIGTNSHEGRFFPRFLDIIPTTDARIAKMFAETDPAVRAKALAAYSGSHATADLGGDVVFWEPSVLVAQAHSRFAPTYMYRYDFAPRLLQLMGLRATHGTELLAVFGFGDTVAGRGLTVFGGRSGLRNVTRTVQSHWLHFAATGAPRSSWPAYDPDRRATLIIDDPAHVEDDPNAAKRTAWLGYRHRR